MKKISMLLLSVFMASSIMSVKAQNVTEGWDNGNDTGDKIVFSGEQQAINKSMNETLLTGELLEYSFNVEINDSYENGDLFTTSLGLNGDSKDTERTNEMCVETQIERNGDSYLVNVRGFGQSFSFENNYLNRNGVYTYTYSVKKNDNKEAEVTLTVSDYGDVKGTISATLGEDSLGLGLPQSVRYLWVFGREVAGDYVFDTDFTIVKNLEYADETLWTETLNTYNSNGNYTQESKAAVESVIAEYKTDLANTVEGKVRAADQNKIQSYAQRLAQAINNLVEIRVESNQESKNETNEVNTWDDGGPFTTDACGNVFDRWGNEVWHAPVCASTVTNSNNGGYQIVNTSDR